MKRRQFLQHALCTTAASALFTDFTGKLSLAHAATTAGGRLLGDDYRALVCVYLYGGNDSFNMVAPVSGPPRAQYMASRGALALPAATLHALSPIAAPGDGGSYGFCASMPLLAGLFNQSDSPLAVLANVGPLIRPLTKAEYESGAVPVPKQLFSHSDQSVTWQLSAADQATRRGWGGRLADMFHASNDHPTLSMNISVDGENVFQAGDTVVPYFVGVDGVSSIPFVTEDGWNAERRASFLALRDAAALHPLQREYARIMRRSMVNGGDVAAALEAATPLASAFPQTFLGRQLQMVARLISARSPLGMRRQIFYVGLGGFDTHDRQIEDQATQLGILDGALAAFHAAMIELGLADSVTTFTASEFGRTTSINGDGTDHGWGGHHLVLGGAVQGRRFYGSLPNLTVGGPDDAGWGQVIPTTAVDQYAATLARWYGVSPSDMATVFPNIGHFASADLGFL